MLKSSLSSFLLGALLLATSLAHAQYAWIDEKGMRQYSDRPPPPGTPIAKILQAPHSQATSADEQESAPPATPAAAARPPASVAEREADYRKRHAVAEENDRKAATDRKTADSKRVHCDSAAYTKAQLDTGRRLRTSENVVVSDEARAVDMARAEKVLKDCQ